MDGERRASWDWTGGSPQRIAVEIDPDATLKVILALFESESIKHRILSSLACPIREMYILNFSHGPGA